MKKIKKLIFFNTQPDVDAYRKSLHFCRARKDEDVLCIALNPAVLSYSRKLGIEASDTLPYFTNDSHARILEMSDVAMNWIRNNGGSVNQTDLGIRHAQSNLFILWLRCPVLYCLWSIEVILNAIAVHNPEVLHIFSRGNRKIASLYVQPAEGYFAELIKKIACKKGLVFERLDISLTVADICGNFLRIFVPARIILKFMLKYWIFQSWKSVYSLRSRFSVKKTVFFTTRQYQMDRLAVEIKERLSGRIVSFLMGSSVSSVNIPELLIRMVDWSNSSNVIEKKNVVKDLANKIMLANEVFSYRGVAYAEMIARKINNNIAGFMTGTYLWAFELDDFLEKIRPSTVVSNGNRSDDLVLAELCGKKGIRNIMVAHGSHVRPGNRYESMEWAENNIFQMGAPFSLLALQTPLSESYLEAFPSEGKAVITGPLIWGRPIHRERSKKLFGDIFGNEFQYGRTKVIVHAATPKSTKALRLYVYETPDEYIRSLRELVKAVKKLPDTVLLIRARPSVEISTESLLSLIDFSYNVKLNTNDSFSDVLGMSDLLVSFSSTTIEEALQNNIPVLLYGGGGRYQHVPGFEIHGSTHIRPSAVYFVKDSVDLEYSIKSVLDMQRNGSIKREHFAPYIYKEDVRMPFHSLIDSGL